MKNTKENVANNFNDMGALLKNSKFRLIVKHPSLWSGDGVDHINISNAATTRLGRWMNGRGSYVFTHPLLGSFRGLENLQSYLKTKYPIDAIRMMTNYSKIKNLVTAGSDDKPRLPKHYRAVVVHSLYLRILQNPALMAALIENELPFDSYSINKDTGVTMRFEGSMYLCTGGGLISDALRARVSPDLTQFLDPYKKKTIPDIYGETMAWLTGGKYDKDTDAIIKKFEDECWAAYDEYVAALAEHESRQEASKQTETTPGIVPIDIDQCEGIMPGEPEDQATESEVVSVDDVATDEYPPRIVLSKKDAESFLDVMMPADHDEIPPESQKDDSVSAVVMDEAPEVETPVVETPVAAEEPVVEDPPVEVPVITEA